MARLNFQQIKTYPLKKRMSKVHKEFLASPMRKGASFGNFVDSLPDILAVKSLKSIAEAICYARQKSKPVIFGVGAHVIKCGLGPILINLMKHQMISALAINGATAIHDFELAYLGETSEDVDESLRDGRFGMVEETGRWMNEALQKGVVEGRGAGEALSRWISTDRHFRHRDISVLAQAHRFRIPVTIHIAIGTDIIHQHPSCRGDILGEASFIDFRKLCAIVADLNGGGVYVNFGSTVILPEVFLKALSTARNLKGSVKNFITANFDMIRHYRPSENVVRRPVLSGGKSFSVIGHHEIMLPLLAGIIHEIKR